ncbi:MAG: helix-turn-helix domain-containing protein [Caulobacterales bacterium]|jgi:hypothetical protein
MAKKTNGKWRTLDDLEIALVKGMKQFEDFPRDYIISFFVRPGRVISPAVVSELDKVRPDILPATREEITEFINRRLNEANAEASTHGFGPTSAMRVREILKLSHDGQAALPGFESVFAEFKRELPADKVSKAKAAKCLAAFANHEGGYLFFGVCNDGEIVGVPAEKIEVVWDQLGDVLTKNFTPFFRWERALVPMEKCSIAVAYAYKSADKPIISTKDFTHEICEGQIYFRYNRSNDLIRAGDLLKMLHERDRRMPAEASATHKFQT